MEKKKRGKIENLTPYPKGVSGNPSGKPKGTKNRSTIVKKWLEVVQKVRNDLTHKEEELSVEDRMTLAQIQKAFEGDSTAYKLLMDSAYGQATNIVEQDITTNGKDIERPKIEFFSKDED